MSLKAAVVLSGCGFKDGSEIHETTLSYLAMAKYNITYVSFAPDRDMVEVVSHLGRKARPATRNILEESARIARGDIKPLTDLNPADFDILWIPGGFGVAKNLSDFATKSSNCHVDPLLASIITDFHTAKKPIVAICIAPVVVAKVLGSGVNLTLGLDKATGEILVKMHAKPSYCKVDEICFDPLNNLYSAPGYMEPPDIAGIYSSLDKIAAAL